MVQDVLPSAAEIRSACKVWHPQSETVWCRVHDGQGCNWYASCMNTHVVAFRHLVSHMSHLPRHSQHIRPGLATCDLLLLLCIQSWPAEALLESCVCEDAGQQRTAKLGCAPVLEPSWQGFAEPLLPSVNAFCLQLIWSCALELACSNWQGQRGKGSKALQDRVDAAITGGTAAYLHTLVVTLLLMGFRRFTCKGKLSSLRELYH